VVTGAREIIGEIHRLRKMYGGGMRQAGILAAAGLYALDHNIDRLRQDHANARQLAEGLARIEGLAVNPARVHSNIVFVDVVREDLDAATLVQRMRERGVLAANLSQRAVRFVTHLDVSSPQIDLACERIAAAMAR
jgi:threonine aldolase